MEQTSMHAMKWERRRSIWLSLLNIQKSHDFFLPIEQTAAHFHQKIKNGIARKLGWGVLFKPNMRKHQPSTQLLSQPLRLKVLLRLQQAHLRIRDSSEHIA